MEKILIAIPIAVILYLFLTSGRKVSEERTTWLRNKAFAHRGLFTKDQSIPENSVAAFKRAVDKGFGIELDVILTKDKELVVFHDDTLKRMTGVDKRVDMLTLKEIKELSLYGTKHKIPTFKEALEAVDGKVPLIIEIKNTKHNRVICEKVLDMLKGYKGLYCIESFNPLIIRYVKKNAPDIIRGQLSSSFKGDKNIPGVGKFVLSNLLFNFLGRPQFIAYRYTDIKNPGFKLNKALGVMTVAWTIESKEAAAQAEKVFDTIIFQHCSIPN